MWKCPVCEELNSNDDELLCQSCGFDGSRDYARYPTLALLSEKPRAVSALKRIQEERQADLLRCPQCRGRLFLFNHKEGAFLCANCGAAIRDVVPGKANAVPQMQGKTAGHRIGTAEHFDDYVVYLHTDGTVRSTGWDTYADKMRAWRDIVSVSCAHTHVVGLRRNGTVVAVGENHSGQCDVDGWKNVITIDASWDATVGLCSDGTVLATGRFLGKVKSWKNIAAIAVGSSGYAVGLHRDGTVVSTYPDSSPYGKVNLWKDISAISVNFLHAVGLCRDGTVVAAGENYTGQCNVQDWKNIVAVSTGGRHAVGLRADGTVVAAGDNGRGQCNVGYWRDIVEVAAGFECTVGLRRDGSLVVAGLSKGQEQAVKNLAADP